MLYYRGTCTIINYNGGQIFSYFYRSFVPSLPYLVIVFCYSSILATFRRVQHKMDKHRASVTSQNKVLITFQSRISRSSSRTLDLIQFEIIDPICLA